MQNYGAFAILNRIHVAGSKAEEDKPPVPERNQLHHLTLRLSPL